MISVSNPIVSCLLRQNELDFVPIQNNLRLQVLPSLEYLPTCHRHQGAAFIRDRLYFVVWADSVDGVETRANSYLEQIIQVFSCGFSELSGKGPNQEILVKEVAIDIEGNSEKVEDAECNSQGPLRRPVLIQAMLTAATLILITTAIGSGWRQIAIEVAIDESYVRLAFLIAAPFQIWLALVII